MKCPKCGEELKEGARFCTSCGVNLEEAMKEKAETDRIAREEAERKAKEEVERLAKEKAEAELRAKEEAERAEAERKAREEAEKKAKEEAEKAEAERKAKEEEEKKVKEAEEEKKRLEEVRKAEIQKAEEEKKIVEEEIKRREEEEAKKREEEFKKVEAQKNEYKPPKIKLRKSFIRRFFERLLIIIILFVAIVAGIYYLNKEKLLPEPISNEIDEFIEKFEVVKNDWLETHKKDDDDNKKEDKVSKLSWKVEPSIEADDIIYFNDEVSIIEVDGKFGLVSNETGKIVLDTEYDEIINSKYSLSDSESTKTEAGIVIKDGKKYYSIDSKYQKSDEVKLVEDKNSSEEKEVKYYYDHYDEVVYQGKTKFSKFVPLSKSSLSGDSKLAICTDIDIVTSDGKTAKDDDLTEETFEINLKKSDVHYNGYFDLTTGKLVIDCNYEVAGDFIDGVAAVKSEDGDAWFIDENGDKVIDYDFEETRTPNDGLAWAKTDGKWGIMEIK